ncbi:uncharacterized protein LOC142338694 isoform X2 [Convolutriloba macropyga]|uniref:uncharacterized protein LOC142338694 isoform X2 n=1 Tax=Convolutriloba macropyga TaxID=536237 RepID=UPI003F528B47
MFVARPASTYNAGLLSKINEWSPTNRPRLWLLLSGASDPPKHVRTSYRRPRDATDREGDFLKGISSDLCNVQRAVNYNISGMWANFCFTKGIAGFECLSACKWNETAKDTPNGGELTLFITGQSGLLINGVPSTTPFFGKKTSYSPETVNGKYVYANLMSSIVKDCSEMLLSQSVYGGEFYGIFDTHSELKGDTKCWVSSWANVVDFINQGYNDNYNVYSHQIDQKTGSNYVYMMKRFGKGQKYQSVKGANEVDRSERFWITNITSDGTWFRVTLTSNPPGYKGSQRVSTASSWSLIREKIKEGYHSGKIITDVCYNTGEEMYMLVMSESSSGQQYKWFGPNDNTERAEWLDQQFVKKQYPTIVFRDPSHDKYLLVTTSDSNRSSFLFIPGFQLAA